MDEKNERLEELKRLLDSGVLNEDEFLAAKKRLLAGDDSNPAGDMPEPNETHPQGEQVLNSDAADEESAGDSAQQPDEQTSNNVAKCLAIIGVALLLIAIIVAVNKNNNGSNSGTSVVDTEYSTSVAETAESYSNDVPATETEYVTDNDDTGTDLYDDTDMFEFNNPWRVESFYDEWGNDTGDRFLCTNLQGTGWNMQIDYIPGNGQTLGEAFRFAITDGEGHMQSMSGPVTIAVRDSDGETYGVEVIGVKGNMAFVEDASTVQGLKSLFNYGHLDILMEFAKYNERHQCRATFDSTEGYFSRAVNEITN